MQNKSYETMAAIDVGSNAIRMLVAQVSQNGEVVQLEDLYQPTSIGRDTFATGRIQISSIHDLCNTLNGFCKVMKQYRVKYYRAASTSGIREAENREYVLEQIRVRSGLNVEVINNPQARYFMFKAVRELIGNVKKENSGGTLIVDIGSGGVEASVYSQGGLKFTEYIKVGSLRLREILADLEKKTLDFPNVLEEFIESRIDYLKPLISGMNIKSFIGIGGEIEAIVELYGTPGTETSSGFIQADAMKKLYTRVFHLTISQIIKEFGLTKNQAEILLPSVILYYSFMKLTKTDRIHAASGSLRHGLLVDMVDDWLDAPQKKDAFEDIVNSIWHIGEKYRIDKTHCKYVENLVVSIFNQMEKVHQLGEREKLYLRAASILHDVGKYVNVNSHDVQSYHIIRFLDIMGLSNRELGMVACIARYHSHEIPRSTDEEYSRLDKADRMTVSKLTAILRIAEALDISHKQKVGKLTIQMVENQIYFYVWSAEDMLLEEWNFGVNVTFFEEVMGYKPILKKRT